MVGVDVAAMGGKRPFRDRFSSVSYLNIHCHLLCIFPYHALVSRMRPLFIV